MIEKGEFKERLILRVLYSGLFIVALVFVWNIGLLTASDETEVITRLNITQALPIITDIEINYGDVINLTEGSHYQVLCNATIVNYNGLGDFSMVNATLFRTNGSSGTNFGLFQAEDNNSNYQMANCSYDMTLDTFTYGWNCTFNVSYHAFNGSWNCTVFANNSLNTPVNATNSSEIIPLFAINVTDVVDLGDLSVYQTSGVHSVNVTNWGNMPINLTLWGYGGEDNATGYNLSFMCPDGAGTNISIGYMRWELRDDNGWVNMTNLTIGPILIDNVTIEKQSTDVNIWNTTYWRLYVPPNPFGACNGTLVYEATLGGTN
ncbi:MAG: hypothetical protein KKG59_00960 [Nanoarchaeota archaeon]|nr:hypothetical protein [Nanoarchaeota archaeon]